MADVFWIGGTGSQSLATVGNYSTGALPGAGDVLWFERGGSTIDSGLTALNAIALAAVNITGNFAGVLGTVANSGDAVGLGATPILNVNCGGLGRAVLDFGSQNVVASIIATGNPADSVGLESVRLRGGGSSSKLFMLSGSCGVCTSRPGLTAAMAEFDISGGILNLGFGVTWAAGYQRGGSLLTSTGTAGTLKMTGGSLITQGTGKITTMDLGGSAQLNHRPASGAAIDTLSIQGAGKADFSGNPAAFSITNQVKIYKDATLITFSQPQPTWTGGLDLVECGFEDVKLFLGKGLLLTVAAG